MPHTLAELQFLSTPSARRATGLGRLCRCGFAISIHALREEGDLPFGEQLGDDVVISIHALREEGDAPRYAARIAGSVFLSTPSARRATACGCLIPEDVMHFYPRPPRGGRPTREYYYSGREQFLSTPSARRATRTCFPT